MSLQVALVVVMAVSCVAPVTSLPLQNQPQESGSDTSPLLRQFGSSDLYNSPYQTVFAPVPPQDFFRGRNVPLPGGILSSDQIGSQGQQLVALSVQTRRNAVNPHVPAGIAALSTANNIKGLQKIPVIVDPSSLLPAVSYEENFGYQRPYLEKFVSVPVTQSLPTAVDGQQPVVPNPQLLGTNEDGTFSIPVQAQALSAVVAQIPDGGEASRPSGLLTVSQPSYGIPETIAPLPNSSPINVPAATALPTDTRGNLPAAIAPLTETSGNIPAAIAPVSQPSGNIPAAIAPVSQPSGNIPAAIAPVSQSSGNIPAAIAPVSQPSESIPAAIAPVSQSSGNIPAAIAPVSQPSGNIPAAIAPVSQPSESIPAAIAPVSQSSGNIPAAIAPVSQSSGNIPAAIAPVSQSSGNIPAAIAPVSRPSGNIPAAIAPVSQPSGSIPAAIAPVSQSSGNIPAAIAPVSQSSGNIPAAIAPVSQPSGSIPAADSIVDVAVPQANEDNPASAIDPAYPSNGINSAETNSITDQSGDAPVEDGQGTSSTVDSEAPSAQSEDVSPQVVDEEVVSSPNSLEAMEGEVAEAETSSVEIQAAGGDTGSVEANVRTGVVETFPEVGSFDNNNYVFNFAKHPFSSFALGNTENFHPSLKLSGLSATDDNLQGLADIYDTRTNKVTFTLSKRDASYQNREDTETTTDEVPETTTDLETDIEITTVTSATEEDIIEATEIPLEETEVEASVPSEDLVDGGDLNYQKVITKLESNREVLDAKYNFLLVWNNEVARQGLYMLRVANIYPETGYVYMPDIEFYTRLIQSNPAVKAASDSLTTVWKEAKQNLSASLDSNSETPEDQSGPVSLIEDGISEDSEFVTESDLVDDSTSSPVENVSNDLNGEITAATTPEGSIRNNPNSFNVVHPAYFPFAPVRSNLVGYQNALQRLQSSQNPVPQPNQPYSFANTYPGFVSSPYQYFPFPSPMGIPFPGFFPPGQLQVPNLKTYRQGNTRPATPENVFPVGPEENKGNCKDKTEDAAQGPIPSLRPAV